MKKTKVSFNYEKLQTSSSILRALAHPLRLKILKFIDNHKGVKVNMIYNTLRIEQSITSQHLRIMYNAGILEQRKTGKCIHYSIDYDRVKRSVKAINNFLKIEG